MDAYTYEITRPSNLRAVAPPPSVYRSEPGHRYREDPAVRAARVATLQIHYESGPGFDQAVREAWGIVVRRDFSRSGFQEAAQWVGWSTRRLLWALRRKRRRLPPEVRAWADAHVARYLRAQKRGKNR